MMIARLLFTVIVFVNLAACGGEYDADNSADAPRTTSVLASSFAPSALSDARPAPQSFEPAPAVAKESAPPPEPAIVAQFSYQSSLNMVTLSAAGSSATEGKIASYAWDFGDGSEASGPNAAHAYASPGEYPVRLTVTDAEGNSTSAMQILHMPSA